MLEQMWVPYQSLGVQQAPALWLPFAAWDRRFHLQIAAQWHHSAAWLVQLLHVQEPAQSGCCLDQVLEGPLPISARHLRLGGCHHVTPLKTQIKSQPMPGYAPRLTCTAESVQVQTALLEAPLERGFTPSSHVFFRHCFINQIVSECVTYSCVCTYIHTCLEYHVQHSCAVLQW